MKQPESVLERKALERCTLQEFLDALASDAKIPGAGSASGIALALGAACAGKAVAITLRHDADNAGLVKLQTQLAELRELALGLAEDDAFKFKRFLESNNPATADALLRTDRSLLIDCRKLDKLLTDNAALIAANMTGDWDAARALSRASRLIQEANVRELNNDTPPRRREPL